MDELRAQLEKSALAAAKKAYEAFTADSKDLTQADLHTGVALLSEASRVFGLLAATDREQSKLGPRPA